MLLWQKGFRNKFPAEIKSVVSNRKSLFLQNSQSRQSPKQKKLR